MVVEELVAFTSNLVALSHLQDVHETEGSHRSRQRIGGISEDGLFGDV
ncbi:hypothetical protein [Psychrobacillus lasiicapitis]|nr:hypothetical protein [Psychrobacillus lasiicapitis]